MMKPRVSCLVPCLWLFLLTACGPPWRVVRQSGPPSALRGQTTIGVTFDWSRAMLGNQPEQVWLAGQPPADQQSYMEVRNSLMQAFVAELQSRLQARGVTVVASTGQEPVQLVVQPLVLEMGFYRFIVNRDSRLDSALVWQVGGQETDHIEVRTTAQATARNAQILTRMNQCAQRTAQLAAQFWDSVQAQ